MNTETETIDYNKLAAAIAEKIGQPLPLDVDLWGADEIARYLKMSKSQVTQRYIPRPDFPRAIRLPTADGHRSHPRWKAQEVIEWASRHQDKKRAA